MSIVVILLCMSFIFFIFVLLHVILTDDLVLIFLSHTQVAMLLMFGYFLSPSLLYMVLDVVISLVFATISDVVYVICLTILVTLMLGNVSIFALIFFSVLTFLLVIVVLQVFFYFDSLILVFDIFQVVGLDLLATLLHFELPPLCHYPPLPSLFRIFF